MYNELIFILDTIFVAAAALIAFWLSLEAMVALVCILVVLMNLFVIKEINLFSFVATASDVLGIGVALCLNLIQEYYGPRQAKSTMWLGFCAAIVYVILSLFHCAYVPGSADVTHIHFVTLLTPMPRIIAASLISFIIIQTIDRHLYALLQRVLAGKYFLIRNYCSVMLTQLLDTVLFSFLGLYGMISNLGDMIMVSYGIKLLTIVLMAPLLALSRLMKASCLSSK